MMSDEEWQRVLDTSLNGLFGATRPAAKQMMRQRRGRIVNITSVSGLTGIAGQTNYAAAKAAIMGFTRALAKELAPSGVPVNAVAPGFVDTDMLAGFSPQQKTAAVARVPMKRFGTVEEIANLVAYLSLEAPVFLTGQTIVIDGGIPPDATARVTCPRTRTRTLVGCATPGATVAPLSTLRSCLVRTRSPTRVPSTVLPGRTLWQITEFAPM